MKLGIALVILAGIILIQNIIFFSIEQIAGIIIGVILLMWGTLRILIARHKEQPDA